MSISLCLLIAMIYVFIMGNRAQVGAKESLHRLRLRVGVGEVAHYRCPIDQALNSFRHYDVCTSQTLMLAEVLRPGIYKKRLQVAGLVFEIPKDPPPISSITTSNAFVLVHSLQKIFLLLRVDFVFHRDEDGAGI